MERLRADQPVWLVATLLDRAVLALSVAGFLVEASFRRPQPPPVWEVELPPVAVMLRLPLLSPSESRVSWISGLLVSF